LLKCVLCGVQQVWKELKTFICHLTLLKEQWDADIRGQTRIISVNLGLNLALNLALYLYLALYPDKEQEQDKEIWKSLSLHL